MKHIEHTREIIAIIWTLAIVGMCFYVLVVYGNRPEVLTLIIGTVIGGVSGTILGAYFTNDQSKKKPEQPTQIDNIENVKL